MTIETRKGAQNSPRLSKNVVASRIEELQARNEQKAEMAAMTRDELIEILTESSTQPVHVCQRLARVTASKPLRCWRRCADGMNLSE